MLATKSKSFYSIKYCDGLVFLDWFLKEEEAIKDQFNREGWGKLCYGSVETFVGSNICQSDIKNGTQEDIEKVNIYFSIKNAGDGSAYLNWFSSEEEAIEDQKNNKEDWFEPCYGKVETYIDSDIYNKLKQ